MQTRWEGFFEHFLPLEQPLLPRYSKLCLPHPCSSADPAQAPTQSSSAQGRSKGRNGNAHCAAERGTFIYLLQKSINPWFNLHWQSPQAERGFGLYTNCSTVSCLKDSWDPQECACSLGFLVCPGISCFGHFALLSSFSVPPATPCNLQPISTGKAENPDKGSKRQQNHKKINQTNFLMDYKL